MHYSVARSSIPQFLSRVKQKVKKKIKEELWKRLTDSYKTIIGDILIKRAMKDNVGGTYLIRRERIDRKIHRKTAVQLDKAQYLYDNISVAVSMIT
jgi:hypothetical protein